MQNQAKTPKSAAKIPTSIKHKMKVNKLKAQLPDGWFPLLQERMKRGQTFVSNMINKYEDWREEWKIVEQLIEEHSTQLIIQESNSQSA